MKKKQWRTTYLYQYIDKRIKVITDDEKTWVGECISLFDEDSAEEYGEWGILMHAEGWEGYVIELRESEVKFVEVLN